MCEKGGWHATDGSIVSSAMLCAIEKPLVSVEDCSFSVNDCQDLIFFQCQSLCSYLQCHAFTMCHQQAANGADVGTSTFGEYLWMLWMHMENCAFLFHPFGSCSNSSICKDAVFLLRYKCSCWAHRAVCDFKFPLLKLEVLCLQLFSWSTNYHNSFLSV